MNSQASHPKPETQTPRFIVGVGASAGGLEALVGLFENLPLDHLAFIVVQHMPEDRATLLPMLLQRITGIKVVAARDGSKVVVNHIYVAPSDRQVIVAAGILRLMPLAGSASDRRPVAVDTLFASLASDAGHRAMGIVLSGCGKDGTQGLRAIRAAGGLTYVQDPLTARFSGMPDSALASGHADVCLSPAAIADELNATSLKDGNDLKEEARPRLRDHQMNQIFDLVLAQKDVDLRHYKRANLERRIDRRMKLHKIETADDYVAFAREHEDEIGRLVADVLISVTRFFRDPPFYTALSDKVLPSLLHAPNRSEPLRIWVAGCATGEEAFSIAIVILEFMAKKKMTLKIQIFATDLDPQAIAAARAARFNAAIATDVSDVRLEEFFVKDQDGNFFIKRKVRDLIIFSKQDILSDAPFSRIDLVSCRNVLIYLKPIAQRRLLQTLHYALCSHGFLALGASETVGDTPEYFSLAHRATRIYAKKAADSHYHSLPPRQTDTATGMTTLSYAPKMQSDLHKRIDILLLKACAPAALLVDHALNVLLFKGDTGAFLNPRPGQASLNLLDLAKPELHYVLRRLVAEVAATQQAAHLLTPLDVAGSANTVAVDALPFLEAVDTDTLSGPQSLVLLILRVVQGAEQTATLGHTQPQDKKEHELFAKHSLQMAEELAATKRWLQATIEERGAAHEEIRASNEELQSANEELQSINEDLETSKEDLQASNEELSVVNQELQERMSQLLDANDDLFNVMITTSDAIVIVGMDLRIRRFNDAAVQILTLGPQDIGRPLAYLGDFLVGLNLCAAVQHVIDSLGVLHKEVSIGNNRPCSLKVRPYKSLDQTIRGAVLCVADLNKAALDDFATRDVSRFAEKLWSSTIQPVLVANMKGQFIWANAAFYSQFALEPTHIAGADIDKMKAGCWDADAFFELYGEVMQSPHKLATAALKVCLPDGFKKTVKVVMERVMTPFNAELVYVSLVGHEDVGA